MLQKIKASAGSLTVKIVLVLLSLTFVLWGTSSIWNLFLQEDVILEINDETFSVAFFENQVANYKEALVRQNTVAGTASQRYRETEVREQVLDSIINATLLRQVARADGIALTDNQLDQIIVSQPAFQIDGRFNQRSYNAFLARSRLTSADYKAYINDDYKINAYAGGIYRSAFFVPTELDFYANWRHQEYNYNYLKLDPADFVPEDAAAEGVAEQLLRAFYEENVEDYYLPAEYTIRYYTLSNDDFIDQLEISDNEVQTTYTDRYGYLFEDSNATLRQIFLARSEVLEQDPVERLNELKEQIVSEEDFIRLAQELSEDEQTAEQGGLLGEFVISDLPGAFAEAIAYAPADEQLFGPLSTELGFHLLWVVERDAVEVPQLEEIRAELVEELRYSKIEEFVLEKAENFSFEILNLNDLDRAAANLGIAGGRNQTFVIGDGFAEEFGTVIVEEVLAMNEGEVSDILFLDNGDYLAMQLTHKRDEQLLPFAQIVPQIQEDYLRSLAIERAREVGERMVQAIASGDKTYSLALAELPAAARDKYSWEEVAGRSRSNADEVGSDASRAVFGLDRGPFPYGGVNLLADGAVEVFVVNSIVEKTYNDVSPAEQLILRGEYLENNRRELNNLVVNSLKESADIQVNEELAGVR